FSVTMTSKADGLVTSSIAVESTSRCSRLISGKSRPTSSATRRHSREVAMTLALSTWVTLRRRVRASSNPSRTRRSISASPYRSGGVVPLGTADRAEQHRVGLPRAFDILRTNRDAVLVDGVAAGSDLAPVDREAESLARRVEDRPGGRDDLRPHPVPGDGHDP